jgi:hypothetical protein
MDRDPIQIHENANERTSIAKLSGLGQTPDLDVTCTQFLLLLHYSTFDYDADVVDCRG